MILKIMSNMSGDTFMVAPASYICEESERAPRSFFSRGTINARSSETGCITMMAVYLVHLPFVG